MRGNMFGFGGTSFGSPGTSTTGLKTKGKSGTHVVNPGWKTKDNNVKRGDEEVQEGKSTPPNACLRCSGCLRGKGCKKVYKWRRLHK